MSVLGREPHFKLKHSCLSRRLRHQIFSIAVYGHRSCACLDRMQTHIVGGFPPLQRFIKASCAAFPDSDENATAMRCGREFGESTQTPPPPPGGWGGQSKGSCACRGVRASNRGDTPLVQALTRESSGSHPDRSGSHRHGFRVSWGLLPSLRIAWRFPSIVLARVSGGYGARVA
jgi:hypothetical protein